MVMLQFQGAIS